jgi:pimeloyl-ACP methyl ester carboxylesterase
VPVQEHTLTLEETPVFYRAADSATGSPAASDATPVYLHGVPTSSDDFVSMLEWTGGIAPDLIGFGRSGKGGHLDYTLEGLTRFVEGLLDRLSLERVKLVGHDWGGAVAVLVASNRPAVVDSLILIDPAPLRDGVAWHRLARLWRRPLLGELVMGSIPKALLARSLRGAAGASTAWPPEGIDAIWRQFDQGTQRATLRLLRSAGPETDVVIARALDRLTMPALLLWGERDPWFPPALADAWAAHLQRVTVERIPDAGHWPWLVRPELVERIAGFPALQDEAIGA